MLQSDVFSRRGDQFYLFADDKQTCVSRRMSEFRVLFFYAGPHARNQAEIYY